MQQEARREEEKSDQINRTIANGDPIEPDTEEGGEEDKQDTEEESEEREEVEELESRVQDGTLLPPSLIDPLGRGFGRQSRRTREGGEKLKKVVEQPVVKDKVATDRQRKAFKDAKHHGKKAHGGKTGRAWVPGAGGKAKTSDQALVYNSLHF